MLRDNFVNFNLQDNDANMFYECRAGKPEI